MGEGEGGGGRSGTLDERKGIQTFTFSFRTVNVDKTIRSLKYSDSCQISGSNCRFELQVSYK